MAAAPIRAIIGRFALDFSQQTMEDVLHEMPFAFGAILSTGTTPRYLRGIPQEHQQWFISSQIRGCEYAGVEWQSLAPVDEELIERMRECEATFMEAVSRLEWKRSIPYAVRKRWYLRHLRFWNDYLTRYRINLYLSAWIPHEIPDIIIDALCKLRGIPVAYFGLSSIRDTSFIERDWEESAVQLGVRYTELLAQTDPATDPLTIPLEERFDQRYRALVMPRGEVPAIEQQEVDVPYWKSVRRLVAGNPFGALMRSVTYATPRGIARALQTWQRRRRVAEGVAFYNAHAVEPDLKRDYVYMPLNFQPEATTVPQAGGYADLILTAELLHATLPPDVLIYVKEHPRPSGPEKRTLDFYKDFAAIPRVRFVPRSFNTFVLREHCRAIATTAGTAGFEGPFRGKPIFLFGHCFYQFAPGTHRIHSLDDCRAAVREIFTERKTPTLLECRVFLKAIEETCVHGVLDPFCFNVSHLSQDENAKNCSRAIIDELRTIFKG
ncbi:MAG: hypothetical protein HOO67_05040 [Candidatus Peribacteraceae bacterium]|nr:hypothetical protein [Candidatus Peribacteraceae bacterium]